MKTNNLKILLLLVISTLALTAFECGEYDADEANLEVSWNAFSKCGERLQEASSDDTLGNEQFTINSTGKDIRMTHSQWSVPCDFTNAWERVRLEGRTIYVDEKVNGGAANCICKIDHAFTIANIPYGRYVIVLRHDGDEKYRTEFYHGEQPLQTF
jgi:hypothetical protein